MGTVIEEQDQPQGQQRFARMYEAHYRSVLAYARRRTRSSTDADEVVSETFLTAWRRLDVVLADDEALPWLFGVARRVISNQRRGNSRRAGLDTRLARQVVSADPEVDAALLANDEHQVVLGALVRLKPDDQELLRLVAWEKLSHRDAARVLGCSEGAVAVRLNRARARLGKELAKGPQSAGHEPSRRPAIAWTREEGAHD